MNSVSVHGSDSINSTGWDIAVDANGNIYTIGSIGVAVSNTDIWIAKYNSSLVLQASTTFKGPGNFYDEGFGISIAPDGNIYTTGFITTSTTGGYAIWIGKYNPSLVLQATTTLTGVGNTSALGYDIVSDSNGNIYATGYVRLTTEGVNAVWIGKYNSSLVLQTSATFTAGYDSNVGRGVAVDSNGNIYVTGTIKISQNKINLFVAKYDPALVLVASVTISAAGNISSGEKIAIDSIGNIFVTGYVGPGGTDLGDIWIGKYDSFLILQASATVNGPGGGFDSGRGIVRDSNNNIFVTGWVFKSQGDSDAWIARYNSSLALQNSAVISQSTGSEAGTNIIVGPGGNNYLIGSIYPDIWIAQLKVGIGKDWIPTFVGMTKKGAEQ